MRIIEEEQLDFDDVLIMPRRSSLGSRSAVDIVRTFEYNRRDDGGCEKISGIPVICANMGTIATPEMAKIFAKNGFFCALEKHIEVEKLIKLFMDLEDSCINTGDYHVQRVFPSIGIRESMDGLKTIRDVLGCSSNPVPVRGINIDVPNGYVPQLIERVHDIRQLFPDAFIMAGTVVTPDICQDLINAGANAVRVGIGGGCFLGDSKVLTSTGYKPICDVKIGDLVLTHTGEYEPVTNKFIFIDHEEIITINGIKCTPDHKFYVANTCDIEKIDDSNYKDYCYWVCAKDLDPEKQQIVELEV